MPFSDDDFRTITNITQIKISKTMTMRGNKNVHYLMDCFDGLLLRQQLVEHNLTSFLFFYRYATDYEKQYPVERITPLSPLGKVDQFFKDG